LSRIDPARTEGPVVNDRVPSEQARVDDGGNSRLAMEVPWRAAEDARSDTDAKVVRSCRLLSNEENAPYAPTDPATKIDDTNATKAYSSISVITLTGS
jgi:hypothetical protein